MNLISRESLTNKSCKAFKIYPYTLSFGAKRAGVRLSTTPAPFTIMKLQSLAMTVATVATAQHNQ
jgi:hypothetical protein